MKVIQRVSNRLLVATALLAVGCFYDTSGGPAEVDAGDTDTETGIPDAGIDGLGAACTESGGECAALEADFCLYNPMDPTQGECTTAGCLAEGCPATYTCCDCTDATYYFTDLCAPSDYAEQLPLAGCTCA